MARVNPANIALTSKPSDRVAYSRKAGVSPNCRMAKPGCEDRRVRRTALVKSARMESVHAPIVGATSWHIASLANTWERRTERNVTLRKAQQWIGDQRDRSGHHRRDGGPVHVSAQRRDLAGYR